MGAKGAERRGDVHDLTHSGTLPPPPRSAGTKPGQAAVRKQNLKSTKFCVPRASLLVPCITEKFLKFFLSTLSGWKPRATARTRRKSAAYHNKNHDRKRLRVALSVSSPPRETNYRQGPNFRHKSGCSSFATFEDFFMASELAKVHCHAPASAWSSLLLYGVSD